MDKLKEYTKKLHNPVVNHPKKMTKNWLYKEFKMNYFEITGNYYSHEDWSMENFKPLVFYFLGDIEKFKECKNVSDLSIPSLKKGLLIIGGYGNGKTSIMESFEVVLRKTNIPFKGYNANKIVTAYEGLKSPDDKKEFFRVLNCGTRYFDDVKTERTASNYGKAELFKEIFETRYSNRARTYITCNYKSDQQGDLNAALMEFGERYGGRIYDRLFEMFNIVEFKGKSLRK